MIVIFKKCLVALKIQCPHGRAGSTPAAGIFEKTRFNDLVFLFCLNSHLCIMPYPTDRACLMI